MPAVSVEPPKSAKPDAFQQSAMAGKSPADMFTAPEPTAPPPSKTSPADFNESLKAAQSQDKGIPASAAPAEPKPAASAEPKSAVPPLPTDDWKPRGKTGEHFDALKAKHAEEMTATLAQMGILKAELAAAKATGTPVEIEAAKKELAEYKAILKDVAIERDPEFKQQYATREKSAIEAATMAAGEKGELLSKLLTYPPSAWRNEQIDALVDGLAPSAQRRASAALQVLEQVDVERSSEIARRRESFDQKQMLTAAQQREQELSVQKAMETEFDSVFKQWTDKSQGHPFFTEIEGNKEHNEAVGNARAMAKAVFSGQLSPKELATAAHWAATGPLALQGWKTAIERAEAAEQALDRLRGVGPGDGRSDGLEGEATQKEAPKPGSPEYLRYMNNSLKAAQAKDFNAKRGIK